MMPECPLVVVECPPIAWEAEIIEDPKIVGDGYYRVNTAEVFAVVKVIEADMSYYSLGTTYYLSDDVEEPGTEGLLFLISTTHELSMEGLYLTDSKSIWSVMGTSSLFGEAPKVNRKSYKVVDCYWEMTHSDLSQIRDAIKRYAGSL